MQELWDACKEYWTTWFFGVIAALLTGRLYAFRKKQEEQRLRQCALEVGMQALLKDRLIQAYEHYTIDKKYITLHGLEAVNDMYKSYSMLDDDQSMKRLVDKLQTLEIRTE